MFSALQLAFSMSVMVDALSCYKPKCEHTHATDFRQLKYSLKEGTDSQSRDSPL